MLNNYAAAVLAPLGTSLLLLSISAVLLSPPRYQTYGRPVLVAAIAWIWLWSMPIAADSLKALLENHSGPRTVDQVTEAPMIVVLGGSIRSPAVPTRPYPDLVRSSDRLWHAARLYRAGKAPEILVSGGGPNPQEPGEAIAMRQFLLDLGVPWIAITPETASRTTAENAFFSTRILRERGVDRVILVTSALHMPRAARAFREEGVTVVPAPTDFEASNSGLRLFDLIPSAEALDGSGRAFKEIAALILRNY